MTNLLADDLNYIFVHTKELWEELRGERIFITGGTGFFGCWLLESFIWANDKLDLQASAYVLTRNPDNFRKKAPHLSSHFAIELYEGDVRNFEFPQGHFSHVIHAATEASTTLNEANPLFTLDTIVQGTKHTLEFALQCQAQKFLLTSSGAVYGKQPPELSHIPEDYVGAPDTSDSRSAYGEGKRLAELLCSLYAKQYKIEVKIARCFAFVGPYLPLNSSFAIGNFIRDALKRHPIVVNGDGTPYRSYLYASDLIIWLWKILIEGKSCYPYNVGSEDSLTIATLARVISKMFKPNIPVNISQTAISGKPATRYVPSTQRMLRELQPPPILNLKDSIEKAIKWYDMTKKISHTNKLF